MGRKKRKFFEGFQFKPKEAAIGSLVMAVPFLVLGNKDFTRYQYYAYEQPGYQSLTVIQGVIVDDTREPPWPYNKREDGIYVDIGDKKINIYCDNPKQPLLGYSVRSGTYDLGRCDWIEAQRSSSCDKTADDELCSDPRYFFGDKITARIDDNHTIYELYVNGKAFYKYDEMVSTYKNKIITNIRYEGSFAMTCVLINIICWVVYFRKKRNIKKA